MSQRQEGVFGGAKIVTETTGAMWIRTSDLSGVILWSVSLPCVSSSRSRARLC